MLPSKPAYHFSQLELGIGDILCSLYGLNGFSVERKRPPITLYLRDHLEWLQIVAIPNVLVQRYTPDQAALIDCHLGDSEADYREKLSGDHAPRLWYAEKLGVNPIIPPLNLALFEQSPSLRRPYIVLAPFATRVNRTWEIHNWRILANEFKGAGYEVIALDAPEQTERCKPIGVDYFWGQPPAWTINVCRHAALIISCDSALAHVGGLLGIKTLVLMSQLSPEKYYAMTDNRSLTPEQKCTGCRFQPSRGYEEKCDFGCWALQSISPRTAFRAALDMIES